MPKAKFDAIYQDLKHKIENQEYMFQDLLPSENTLVTMYGCSRNTVRRALGMLIEGGYVQARHGKGVQVIYQPPAPNSFIFGGIESFQETVARNKMQAETEVICFTEITCDERTSVKTGFAEGAELYYVQRVRRLNGKALILDINIILKELVPELTPEICSQSIYNYIEGTLGMQIVTSKRKITAARATSLDEEKLDLNGYDFVAVVTGQTFNADGIMFEYTQSRHHPDYFCFEDTATRKK